MAYVMFSRVQSLQQLYIVNAVDQQKITVNDKVIQEAQRMHKVSLNQNPCDWMKPKTPQNSIQEPQLSIQNPQLSKSIQKPPLLKVCSFNTCSLRKHMEDIRSDPVLMQSNILFVQETWLEKCEEEQEQYQLEGYRAHFASQGRGKGLAAYIKAGIRSIITIFGQPNFQIVKFDMANIDVIGIYRSRTEPLSQLTQHLRQFINPEKDTLIVGDVNVCATKNNELGNFLQKERFCQLVSLPTHICGGIHLKHNLIKHVFSNSCTCHNIALFRIMYNENIHNRFTC